MTAEMSVAIIKAFDGIRLELSLIRKQIEKLDRTVSKLNEAPSDVVVDGNPSQK
jgi:hypothetical protein